MALNFNGSSDKVSHGDVTGWDGASALTTMFWANPDTLGTDRYLFGKTDSASAYTFTLQQDPSTNTSLMVRCSGDPANNAIVTSVFAAGTWVHVAAVFDGSLVGNNRLKIYINGTVATPSYSGTIPATLADSAASVVMSGARSNSSAFFDGSLAAIKVWTVALTAAEVANEMHVIRPTRTANLIQGHTYDDGTSAKDYFGAGNHGTVTGTTQVQGPPVGWGGMAIL